LSETNVAHEYTCGIKKVENEAEKLDKKVEEEAEKLDKINSHQGSIMKYVNLVHVSPMVI